jgi:DNA-binding winged helix-turn-helix (wHTH) protein
VDRNLIKLRASTRPGITIDEGSPRFQMASLRKVLGDGRDGARYIPTLAERGYSFVAPISPPGNRAIKKNPLSPIPFPPTCQAACTEWWAGAMM